MRATPLFLLVVMTAGPVAAQEPNPLSLTVGDQIRLPEPANAINPAEGYMMALTTLDDSWVNGSVTKLEADGFSFAVEGTSQVYTRPYSTIDMIDVKHRIRHQSVKTAALWGLYLGATLGAISAPFAAKTMPIGMGSAVAMFGAAGGVGGTALGAAIGAVLVPSRWYRHVYR